MCGDVLPVHVAHVLYYVSRCPMLLVSRAPRRCSTVRYMYKISVLTGECCNMLLSVTASRCSVYARHSAVISNQRLGHHTDSKATSNSS